MSGDHSPAVSRAISVHPILDSDYGEIDPQLEQWLHEHYTSIRGLLTQTALNLVLVGRQLAEVKAGLAHEEFLAFVAALGLSRSTAYRWMRAAQAAVGCSHVENVEPSALYALSAKSTPNDVRDGFLQRADAGHRITVQEVQAALGQHRPSNDRPAPDRVERLVDSLVAAEDAGAGRDWRGRDDRVEAIAREIGRFEVESRAEVAAVVAEWGRHVWRQPSHISTGRSDRHGKAVTQTPESRRSPATAAGAAHAGLVQLALPS